MSSADNNDFMQFANNYHGKDVKDVEGDTRNKKNWKMENLHSHKEKEKSRINYIKEKKLMQRDEYMNDKEKLAREEQDKRLREEEMKENSNKRSNRRKEKHPLK
jgi:hypothetical protein